MDKNILKEIAKRYAKGLMIQSEAGIHFEDSCLTEDECDFIQKELYKIGERITQLPAAIETNSLVNEYYKHQANG